MGHQSIVFGRIIGDRFPWGGNININNDRLLYHRLNRMIIDELPEKDDYPQLTRQMFVSPSLNFDEGLYKNQVIVFGASYKEVELYWLDWVFKFENLLTKLYWTEAIVYLETEFRGNHSYTWKNNNESPFQPNIKNTKDNWKIEGKLWEFK